MPAPIPESLQKKVADRLAFYQDLGIAPFYRDRHDESVFQEQPVQSAQSAVRSTQISHEEPTLPKPLPKPNLQKPVPAALPPAAGAPHRGAGAPWLGEVAAGAPSGDASGDAFGGAPAGWAPGVPGDWACRAPGAVDVTSGEE